MDKNVTKFQIDRAKWRTGRYDRDDRRAGRTALLNAEGFQCCLGFYLESAGIGREVLRNEVYPQGVAGGGIDLGWLVDKDGRDSEAAECLIGENDCGEITDDQREAAIAELFAEQRIEVEFVGEYPEVGDAKA